MELPFLEGERVKDFLDCLDGEPDKELFLGDVVLLKDNLPLSEFNDLLLAVLLIELSLSVSAPLVFLRRVLR